MNLNAEMLASAAGIALSLVLNYFPGLNVKFAALSSEQKSGIVALSLLGLSLLIVASSCLNLWLFISCDKQGLMTIFEYFVFALVSNQSAYKILPQTKAVKQAIQERDGSK